MTQYQIKYEGRVIVGTSQIADLDHALAIKAAIDSPEHGIEVQVVEVPKPAVSREIPKIGYVLFHRNGADVLEIQLGESAYGGWSFRDEGYDPNTRLYEREDGHPHTVLVYAANASEALKQAHEIRAIFEAEAPKREEMKRRRAEEQAAYDAAHPDIDEDDDWLDDDWLDNDEE